MEYTCAECGADCTDAYDDGVAVAEEGWVFCDDECRDLFYEVEEDEGDDT